jgi:O-antigen/teichoic acid export membrane protein
MVIASAVGGVLGVIFAFQGFGVYALVVQQISTAILSTILLWSTSGWKPDLKFSMAEVKKLTGFSTFVFFDRFVSTIFQRLDVLLIGKIFSPATLGFYTRAVSLKDQVTNYSSSSLTKVFYPVLSGLQDDQKEYSRIYFKVLSVISFISFGLTGALYILGAELIILLFGAKWHPSIAIFQVLILAVCNRPLNSMMVNAFLSKGKSKENFTIGVFRKILRVIPLIIAYQYGIFEFTVAVVIVSYFLTIINILFLKKYLDLSIWSHFKKIFEGIIPVIVFIIAFHSINLEVLSQKLILAASFIVFYILYNNFLQVEGYLFIIKNVKSKLFKNR